MTKRMEKKNKEIKDTTAGLMIGTALFFDGLQAIFQVAPAIGQILAAMIAVVAFLTFWLWFKLYGVNFATPKRSAYLGGGFIIELIPILDILPAWTLAVTLIITDLKIKRRVGGEENEQNEDKNVS